MNIHLGMDGGISVRKNTFHDRAGEGNGILGLCAPTKRQHERRPKRAICASSDLCYTIRAGTLVEYKSSMEFGVCEIF